MLHTPVVRGKTAAAAVQCRWPSETVDLSKSIDFGSFHSGT